MLRVLSGAEVCGTVSGTCPPWRIALFYLFISLQFLLCNLKKSIIFLVAYHFTKRSKQQNTLWLCSLAPLRETLNF